MASAGVFLGNRRRPVPQGTRGAVSYEELAAGRGIAAAVVVAATAAAGTAAIAAAAPDDDQQNDDPAAVATAKTVNAHTGTSYEFVDRPNRSQSIVCRPGKGVPLFSSAGNQIGGGPILSRGEGTLVKQYLPQGLAASGHPGVQGIVGDIDQIRPQEGAALKC